MNTGSGKTVVGLVILKSCLNEGVGPAVYIAPDIYLKNQVVAEATALGIEVTTDAESPRFLRSQAILVANIKKLVKGSRFQSEKCKLRKRLPDKRSTDRFSSLLG
jgi:replicative superfamily II helicase